MRNQRKVRSLSMPKNIIKSRKELARKFSMVAEQVNTKGLNRAQINTVRLNVKDFLPQKFKRDRNVIGGYTLEAESGRFIPLSNVILHRLLSMTEGESNALVQSLMHTACGYEAWRQLNVQYYGGSVARHAGEMLKHNTQWLQTIQEYEATHKTKINDDI
eukprot:5143668-Amphidinium_carterae.1